MLHIATLRRALVLSLALPFAHLAAAAPESGFVVEETTIARIHEAILARKLTATELVKLYLARIKAYNGQGVESPEGWYGPSKFIAHAKGINALATLNLRPATLKAWGFDDHHARSMTDKTDADPSMPDALEVATRLDAEFARTGKLAGPLHGVVMAIKDQYDTFDMRTTSGTDAFYANDRPPQDATFVARLRAAGAIILAKANVAEDASGAPRSAFGGAFLNPYDTERSPGGSSSGSGSSVAANLVTAAIGEETTTSVRSPAHWNCAVGIAPTQELVSRHGMMGMGLNTRVGTITRTVDDTARILTVIAGYDRKDPMTAFTRGRMPEKPYESFTGERSLKGLRIGVVREYMDKAAFAKADEESIDIVNRAIEDLRKLGATIVDPGEHGELFTSYIRALAPALFNITFARQHPEQFPLDADGNPATDQIATLLDMTVDPSLAPGNFTLRDLGTNVGRTPGEAKFEKNLYWRLRGDANIGSIADRAAKANFYHDPAFPERKPPLLATDAEKILDTTTRLQRRFAVQQIILQAFADLDLDAVVYPTGTLPPTKLGSPPEPPVNGRTVLWTFLGTQGFPAICIPAGFTTHVYDRERDPAAPPDAPLATVASRLVGPVPATLPVGVDFLGIPYSEPVLLRISAAYEAATGHRSPPPDFGPLASSR
ncbi:amidase, Asp-tRNAAsn/Glu-tRNAGln amidotransferase A subunit [Opitutaceae bacterium TAV1]|nr:amidase, Asp-tRNAAsn/Glu-tRNAGln amidotransferase A subunit [Opitutaceae bacterium TAV1]